MALSAATQEAEYLRQLEREFWTKEIQITIYCDNRSALSLAATDHHFIREKVADEHIKLISLSTDDMVADVLTKAVPRNKHEFCTTKMNLTTNN